jgi:chloramphenicol 3-O-phosphotransferase
LQAVLPDPWLTLGVDTLIEAMPTSSPTSATGIEFASDGEVIVGPEFRAVEAAWMTGIAAMARAGARVLLMRSSSAERRPRTGGGRCSLPFPCGESGSVVAARSRRP